MNKVIDKGFRSCRFVSTIVKHPVSYKKIKNQTTCICKRQWDTFNLNCIINASHVSFVFEKHTPVETQLYPAFIG